MEIAQPLPKVQREMVLEEPGQSQRFPHGHHCPSSRTGHSRFRCHSKLRWPQQRGLQGKAGNGKENRVGCTNPEHSRWRGELQPSQTVFAFLHNNLGAGP